MKKSLLLKLLFLLPILQAHFSSAQITLNSTYNPAVGDIFYGGIVNDTTIQPGPAGANVIWNYSSMFVSLNTFAESFVNPSSTPYAANFSGSNLAVNAFGGGYHFYTTYAGGMMYRGFQSATNMMSINDTENILTYPFTYLSSVSNDSITGTASSGAMLSGTLTSIADAYGTLQLSTGNVANVLRVKTIYNLITSFGPGTETYYTTTKYTLYKSGTKRPVMQITIVDVSGLSTFHDKQILVGNLITGMNDLSGDDVPVQVFPNPSRQKTTVQFSLPEFSDVSWILSGETGNTVFERKDHGLSAGSHSAEFDFSSLGKGIYFLRLTAGKMKSERKIIVE